MENEAPVKPSTGRTILRWIGKTIIIIVALISAGIAYAIVQNWMYQQAVAKVTVDFDQSGKGCDPQFPLALWIRNGSSRVVTLTYIEFEARRPGYSTDLVAYGSRSRTWDKIIRPGMIEGVCYPYPEVTAPEARNDHSRTFRDSLEWTAKISHVTFSK
jgi:hypothetical protein